MQALQILAKHHYDASGRLNINAIITVSVTLIAFASLLNTGVAFDSPEPVQGQGQGQGFIVFRDTETLDTLNAAIRRCKKTETKPTINHMLRPFHFKFNRFGRSRKIVHSRTEPQRD